MVFYFNNVLKKILKTHYNAINFIQSEIIKNECKNCTCVNMTF